MTPLIPGQHYLTTASTGPGAFQDMDGSSQCFLLGFAFILPKGFNGSWEMPVPPVKRFAQYGDAYTIAAVLASLVEAWLGALFRDEFLDRER